MHIPTLIARKRDGHELTEEEIRFLIDQFTSGNLPDYQMAAWAMAVYFQNLSHNELSTLTEAMIESGQRFTWPEDKTRPVVDKHSTGGIGDKVSLILAPLLACTGHRVPMVSGRGLGITGGTLDKLETIPGFFTNLDFSTAQSQLDQLGVFMMGQTADFCPADKKLYALRDVTGTVPSIPLITASIMSKKLAEGLDRLVLDVKFGTGAFMQTRHEAEKLAQHMLTAGNRAGVDTHALLTPMDEPLGHAVGNFTEVRESIQCLLGKGPHDLETLTLDLCAAVAKVDRAELHAALHDGRAYQHFLRLAEAQGADLTKLDALLSNPNPPQVNTRVVTAERSGTVTKVDAGTIGQLVLELGGGRNRNDDTIHPHVGIEHLVKCGQKIHHGAPLATLHSPTHQDPASFTKRLQQAVEIK